MSETTHSTDWMTPAQLAERWCRSSDTIIRWCRQKKLPAMQLPGGGYLISRRVVEEREAATEATEARRTMRNARRNRQYTPSGVDHFGSGKQH